MNAPLYTPEILRLTTAPGLDRRLADAMASVEKRSPVCGSRIIIDIDLDADGRISDLGMQVRACALGQASAALFEAHARGRHADEIAAASDAVAAWLSGERAAAPEWPGIDLLAPAIPHRGRHAAIRLPFEAAADACAAILKERG
ncbi:iron-sulfur cluster assembly scaffold protein [Sphingomonas sp.]|uniref:iron-sulfur cluster assembly scaffold protein n=1 Tax=Sphingomonas sp. TaxID=28214 RepID=UPI001EB503B9|nr:iron-sulfur cluster assembly scaffold protein [Sphingomonas sp.]MBX3594483.1 iron-sulfur cluster assembly scaffold protein [Sphingomonas sp.]